MCALKTTRDDSEEGLINEVLMTSTKASYFGSGSKSEFDEICVKEKLRH